MKQVVVLAVALAVAQSGSARADDGAAAPGRAKPFLTQEDSNVATVTGAFGPSRDTMMVFASRGLGTGGKYLGFALVPDDKASHGQRRLELPTLPQGDPRKRAAVAGELRVFLVANLDKDADDELVVGFSMTRTATNGRGNGLSYSTWEYAVLDWNGKKFVRLPALERKLARTRDSGGRDPGTELGEDEIRAALGVAKP